MIRYLLPLGGFVALVAILGVGLTLNPREVPSPLIGKPAPEFELPRLLYPERSVATVALTGRATLLNFWATWCVACREEHPLLVRIAESGGVPVYGINYKDEPDKARQWLAQLGDPYVASGVDESGATGIEFGVYGLPETFVIGADGTILHKHIGPLTEQVWNEELLPMLREAGG